MNGMHDDSTVENDVKQDVHSKSAGASKGSADVAAGCISKLFIVAHCGTMGSESSGQKSLGSEERGIRGSLGDVEDRTASRAERRSGYCVSLESIADNKLKTES